MAQAYVGEMRIFPYAKVPPGWHVCDGAVLTIRQYNALYSLIGTAYGGDGQLNFALPDLRGRVALHVNPADTGFNTTGKAGGADEVALTTPQLPQHSHQVTAFNTTGKVPSPLGNTPAAVAPSAVSGAPAAPWIYGSPVPTSLTALNPGSLLATGGGQGHENRQPTMALQWCICVTGYYPNRP